jgi:hypothetical protein
MNKAVLAVLFGAGLAVAAGLLSERGEVFAQRPACQVAGGPGSGLIALSETIDQKYQQVTVIDPGLQVLAVYHIDLASGKITLCSVRNVHWDLQMLEYNGADPLPSTLKQEFRSLLEQR